MNALEIRNLTKSYPGFMLDNLNMTLPSRWGLSAKMVLRNAVPSGISISPITIEELFVFMVKEAR